MSNTKPVAKWTIGELVQSKAGGPKFAVDAIHIPTSNRFSEFSSGLEEEALAEEKAADSGVKYWCIWWVGSKRHREQFSEGGLTDWVEPMPK